MRPAETHCAIYDQHLSMISLNYNLTTFKNFLESLSIELKTKVDNNELIIPESFGKGYFKAIEFEEINVLCYSFTMFDDLYLKKNKENKELYTLIIEETINGDKYNISIENYDLPKDSKKNSIFYLTSFLYDVELLLYKNIPIKGTRILLPVHWMQKYLGLNRIEDVLEKYISLKTENIWQKPIDVESREIFHSIFNQNDGNLLHYQNKILRLVEIFFNWLSDSSKNMAGKPGINRVDIQAAQKVENILTSPDVVIPPTIKELAREAAMSESKLKKVFKSIYDMPIYEYFQKQRMQKARLMLISGDYAIKDVGYTLGYANLSNFTLAFKKEFGKLPSEIIRKVHQ